MMTREVIATDRAPAAVGPYSQAVRVGEVIYCSGQIPLTPNGTLVSGDIAAQTRQVMANLSAVLEAAGASLSDLVKTTIYCVDLNDFAAINEAYGACFESEPPARATVEVAALPKGAGVEIEGVAVVSG